MTPGDELRAEVEALVAFLEKNDTHQEEFYGQNEWQVVPFDLEEIP